MESFAPIGITDANAAALNPDCKDFYFAPMTRVIHVINGKIEESVTSNNRFKFAGRDNNKVFCLICPQKCKPHHSGTTNALRRRSSCRRSRTTSSTCARSLNKVEDKLAEKLCANGLNYEHLQYLSEDLRLQRN